MLAPAAWSFAEGVRGWVRLSQVPVTAKRACIFSCRCLHIWHATTEPPKKRPRAVIDKLRNSAISSLPAVLPIHTADISPDRAAGPISVWHGQGTVPCPSSCQSGWGQQGSPQWDRGSAVPGIVQKSWEWHGAGSLRAWGKQPKLWFGSHGLQSYLSVKWAHGAGQWAGLINKQPQLHCQGRVGSLPESNSSTNQHSMCNEGFGLTYKFKTELTWQCGSWGCWILFQDGQRAFDLLH